jgi:hypothetical protein
MAAKAATLNFLKKSKILIVFLGKIRYIDFDGQG